MIERLTKREDFFKLFSQVDRLLADDLVKDELAEIRHKASAARTSSRAEVLKKPPRLRFVYEFNVAIFDPKRSQVHEGRWSDFHSWIAQRVRSDLEDRELQIKRYYSGDVFELRGAQGIKVLVLDTLDEFSNKHLQQIVGLGYIVMSPDYLWLLPNMSERGLYFKIPSSLFNR